MEIILRPEAPVDATAVHDLTSRAFATDRNGSDAAPMIRRIRISQLYRRAWTRVAVVDGNVVGFVMVSGAWMRHRDGRPDRTVAMLTPLAVDPEHQGRGVGSALVRDVVRGVDGDGEPLIVLEGDPRFYGRLGFEDARVHGITLPLPSWAPAGAGQVVLLRSHDADLRGEVVYPSTVHG